MVLKQVVIPSKRRAWSRGDKRDLKEMAKRGVHAAKIGNKLKRTEGAVRQEAFKLGISFNAHKAA